MIIYSNNIIYIATKDTNLDFFPEGSWAYYFGWHIKLDDVWRRYENTPH